MALSTPSTMRSLFVTAYTQPLKYEISELPTPKIEFPDHVLIRVHAASINPVDMAVAGGALKMLVTFPFPYKLGFDLSGTVAGIGDSVKGLAVGDEVFCCLPEQDRGSLSEYALTRASYLVPKPERLSHAEAASIPLVAMTALQAFEKVAGGLTGKNVFVPGGLSGVGSIACQLAKNVLGAAKVITTVSTQKLDKVDEKLGQGTVDQVIDYKKTNPLKEIPRGSVDVLLETVGSAMTFLPLLSKNNSMIVSVHGPPSGSNTKKVIPHISYFVQVLLDFIEGIYRFRASRYGVKYESMLQNPEGSDLERIAAWIEEGKLKPIVGKTIRFGDLQAVRDACSQVASNRGGIGKVVVEII